MSTKYILHGGVTGERSDSNEAYYREMIAGVDDPSVLLVYFARGPEEYDYLYNRDTSNFAWANPGIEIKFTVANADDFIEQIKSHNVIYFMGGETQKLLDAVKPLNLGRSIFKGRVISGSSAGAYLLSSYYYANTRKDIFEGLGFLPIAVWAHYRADRGSEYWLSEEQIADIEQQLQEKVGDGEVVKLPEQEFVVYNQI